MRLFTAIFPPTDVVKHLAEVVRHELLPRRDDIVWNQPEDWHLTLKFHGELKAREATALAGALRAGLASTPPFGLALAGAGTFEGRVVWVGVSEPEGAPVVNLLVRRVRQAARAAGLEVEMDRPHQLHLTLGILRNPHAEPASPQPLPSRPLRLPEATQRALDEYRGPTFRVDEVELAMARTGPIGGGRGRYDTFAKIALGE